MSATDIDPAMYQTSCSFLLTQLGTHAARQFAERVGALDLTPPQTGLLRAIAAGPGRSQQALAQQLGAPATRLVALVDALEQRGLVQRRRNPEDRRLYAVYLSDAGAEMLARIGEVAREQDETLLAPLSAQQREALRSALSAVAAHQELVPGVHPGYHTLPAADATSNCPGR